MSTIKGLTLSEITDMKDGTYKLSVFETAPLFNEPPLPDSIPEVIYADYYQGDWMAVWSGQKYLWAWTDMTVNFWDIEEQADE